MKYLVLVAWLVAQLDAWMIEHNKMRMTQAHIERTANAITDAAIVAADPTELPLPGHTRTQTLEIMASVAWFESFYAKDVGQGKRRGDQGDSWCWMQVRVGRGSIIMVGADDYRFGMSETPGGWTGKMLVDDPLKCWKAGKRMLYKSIKECGDLSQYTTGRCQKGGNHEAFIRYNLAKDRFFNREPAGSLLP